MSRSLALRLGCASVLFAAFVPAHVGCSSTPAPGAAPTDYLIVTADTLAASAGRFRDLRKDGHVVELALVSTVLGGATTQADATKALRDFIQKRWAARAAKKPFYVLFVGDADGTNVNASSVPVASAALPAGPVVSDNVFADMDGDGIPDLALGRVPAHTDEEVDAVRAKIQKYETTYVPGPQARRINLFASTSGFGEPADTLIETLVFKVVEEIPYDFDITMTYAKQDSPYVFVPERFSDKVYERINEGSLMVAYVGHGYQDGFANLDWNKKSFPIMDTAQLSKIVDGPKAPVLTLIACATGAFSTGDSVSEKILRGATGPVAVLSSTEDSHPYPNAIFVRELEQVIAVGRTETIGQAFVAAKQRMIQNDDALRKTIDNAVSAQVDSTQQKELKRSHLDMYTLFGDPAMRIAYPGKVGTLTVPPTATPGSDATVTLATTALTSGNVRFTLEIARSDLRAPPGAVPADGDPGRDPAIEANYAAANDKVVVTATATLAAGTASAKLALPVDLAPGDYHVKAYADDGKADVAVATTLHVGP
jgi:hypothetical protein